MKKFKNLDPMTKSTIKACALQTAILVTMVVVIKKNKNDD